jgi:hypothetical protein
MKPRKSDIPQDVTEVTVRRYRQIGPLIYFRVTKCIFDGQVVGQRAYDGDGSLQMETPLRDGRKHGREYVWDETGALESVEPYVEGKMHGVARQYNRNGKVIGTYRFVRGTGYDIWRYEREDGSIGVSEIFSARDGALDGFEWWLRDDQRSVAHERHWKQGKYHGIERMWNHKNSLRRGYPKYWIDGQKVNKRIYLRASERDDTLPKYQERENQPQREFPADIEKLLSKK